MKKTNTEKIRSLLDKFFNGDMEKTDRWLENPNPLFGKLRPIALIRGGKSMLVKRTVENMLRMKQ